MTTLQMQNPTNFEPSATEDPMELTSDMDRRFATDEDIDIDLDLTSDRHQDPEDAYMGEDVNVFTNPIPVNEQEMYTANDDVMADDAYAEGSVVGRSSVHDEDLEDAASTVAYLDEDTITESHTEYALEGAQEFPNSPEAEAARNNDPEYHEMPSTSEAESGVVLRIVGETQTDLSALDHAASLLMHKEDLHDYARDHEETSRLDEPTDDASSQGCIREPLQVVDNKTSDEKIINHNPSPKLFAGEESYASAANLDQPVLDEETAVDSKEDMLVPTNITEEEQIGELSFAPGEPTLPRHTYVHPVLVLYQDTEISLFPPVDQDEQHSTTYLLQDEQLAGESIKKLLGACRSILGDSITNHDELVISIDGLDLEISESTTDPTNITLLHLIDIHINLHHNDGLEHPPPLYMQLITKTIFSHRLVSLQNAIMQGKGFSQLWRSEVYYDDQHAEAEGDQGYGGEDDLQHTDGVEKHEAEASVDNGGTVFRDTHQSDDSRSDALALTDMKQKSPTTTQISVPNSSVVGIGEESNIAGAQLDLEEDGKIGIGGDGTNGRVDIIEEASRPSTPLSSHAQAQRPVESTLENEDSIEYEDDEAVPGTSSRTSTLRDDNVDINADQHYDELKDGKPFVYDSDINDLLTVPDSTVEAEKVDEEHTVTAGIEGQGPYDIEDDLSDHNYREVEKEEEGEIEEQEHNSGDNYDEEWDEEAVGVQEQGQRQGDQLGPFDNANDIQDEVSSQQEYPEDTSAEAEEQAAPNGREEPTGNGALSEIGSDDRLRSPLIQNEDENFPDSQAEEQTNIDVVERGGGLQEDSPHVFHPSDDHVNPSKETLHSESNVEPPESDDDEISYEDEDDGETAQETLNINHNAASSPGSLKRNRSFHEEDNQIEEGPQDAKRVRSN